MSAELKAIFLFIFIFGLGLLILWNFIGRPSIKPLIKKMWSYGTQKPVQRIGLILLCVGIISFVLWDINDTAFRFSSYYGFYWSYSFPDKYDFWIYHLHVYLIPIGLMASWGYPSLQKLQKWVFKNK